ncbi:MAG: mechanosensitive ion channel family protein [Bacillota bacterium]|nr:mechanosensitive ion channel family protein [Bacillota bacterium]
MENFILSIKDYFLSSIPYITIASFLVGVVLFKKSRRWLKNYIRSHDYSIQTSHNLIMIYNVLRFTICLFLLFFVLQLHGVNVSSVFSALGVIGIVVGFALQDALKDWISGFNILINRPFVIGDVVKINGYVGRVKNLDLYTTRIEELYTENIVTISNREIATVEIVSNVIFYNIPFSYEMDLKTCHEMIKIMVGKISLIEGISLCRYDGTAEFLDSLINQRVRVEIEDKMKLPAIKRKINDVILEVYDQSEWSIPYNHLTVELESHLVK